MLCSHLKPTEPGLNSSFFSFFIFHFLPIRMNTDFCFLFEMHLGHRRLVYTRECVCACVSVTILVIRIQQFSRAQTFVFRLFLYSSIFLLSSLTPNLLEGKIFAIRTLTFLLKSIRKKRIRFTHPIYYKEALKYLFELFVRITSTDATWSILRRISDRPKQRSDPATCV